MDRTMVGQYRITISAKILPSCQMAYRKEIEINTCFLEFPAGFSKQVPLKASEAAVR
jgi:hypothetical protein